MNINSFCDGGIQLCGTDGWQLQQIIPTERHFILFHKEAGLDYVMADTILLFSRVVDGSIQFKSIGLNLSMTNYYDEYWLEETENQGIYDKLNLPTLRGMIQHLMTEEDYTREEAILNIKSDFERTKVNIDCDVRLLFKEIE